MGSFSIAVLALLIFFSKTIYTYHLPAVSAVKPQNGTLDKWETSPGIANWAGLEKTYAPLGGIVREVLIKEGERIKKGQPLFKMEYDRDEALQKLQETKNNRVKLELEIRKINLKLNQTAGSSDKEVSSYELELIDLDIKKAEAELSDAEKLYKVGAITKHDLDAAQTNLESLRLKRENAENNVKTDRAALLMDLEAKKADLKNLDLQEKSYQEKLKEYDTYSVITSSADGLLLTVSAEKGARINENELMASIGVGNQFTVECTISLDNNFVIAGDECELENSSHVLKGVVSSVTPTAEGKTVKVAIVSDEVTAGETFDVIFEKSSAVSYTLVPNGALNQDDDGYFLNLIKRRDGILGKEYYIERLDVFIGDSDSENTAIVKGITFFEPIVLVSDKPVTAGDVISIENAGDFFED